MKSPSQEPAATSVDPRVIRFRPGLRREGDHPVRFCTIHGYRRAFVCFGRGPALLLIHGIGDSSDTWQPVLDELGRNHTIVAPDLLGHGRSEKPRADYSIAAYANGMRDLLSVLEIDRATVIGHSLGGGVAAQFAYQFPERCERLVLVDSGGIGRSVSPFLRLAAVPGVDAFMPFFGLPPVRTASRLTAGVLRHFSTAWAGTPRSCSPSSTPFPIRRPAPRFCARSVLGWTGRPGDHHARSGLSGGGDADADPVGSAPCDHPPRTWPTCPRGQCRAAGSRSSTTGHFPHHSDPAKFIQIVSDFIERSVPARSMQRSGAAVCGGGARRSKQKLHGPIWR